MNKISFKQIIAGISVMLSTMFLLILAGNTKSLNQATTTVFKGIDTQLSKPIKSPSVQESVIAPDNIVAGSFSLEAKDEVVYADDQNKETFHHYKPIRSERLTQKFVRPQLKVEINQNGTLIWQSVDWSWIDYDQGILYFEYKTEENAGESAPYDYTGSYQLIF